jgi:transposase
MRSHALAAESLRDRLFLCYRRVTWAHSSLQLCYSHGKKAILHRRNACFYKTENGAHVGDLFMSLIHTCELNGVNPSTT